ncbi:hypothetical protein Tco_0059063 [Tanacetum coccineum]
MKQREDLYIDRWADLDILDDHLRVEILTTEQEQSRRHALFSFSKIQQSGYGLLEVRSLVCQNLVSRSVPHGASDASYENSPKSQIPEVGQRNNCDGGNTGDGGKIVGGAIGACSSGIGYSLLVALYARMTFIYGSSWKGEMSSKAEQSIDESSEESEEVFPGEAGE